MMLIDLLTLLRVKLDRFISMLHTKMLEKMSKRMFDFPFLLTVYVFSYHHLSTNGTARLPPITGTTHSPSICSAEGLMLKTSASLSLHGGNLTLINFFDTKF